MEFFGPLVILWEGSNQGKGYLRYAKPKINNIHSKNWKANAHLKILSEKAFDIFLECHMNNQRDSVSVDEHETMNQRDKNGTCI